MVDELREGKALDKIAEQTGANAKVYSQMLQGTLSAGISELGKYTIKEVLGA